MEVPERIVTVNSIEVKGIEPEHGVALRVCCGKGTYIRTLCDDLGKKCGCPAHMRSLVRTRSGVFTIDTGLTLDEARELALSGNLAARMLPPDYPIRHLRAVEIPGKFARQVASGAKIPAEIISGDLPEEMLMNYTSHLYKVPVFNSFLLCTEYLRVYLNDVFWGIMHRSADSLVWNVQISPEPVREKTAAGD